MKWLIFYFCAFFALVAYANPPYADTPYTETPMDLVHLCIVEDPILANPDDFPRWGSLSDSDPFVSLNNLTDRMGVPSETCNRLSSINDGLIKNEGEDCHITLDGEFTHWAVHLVGEINGTIENDNGVEITNFSETSLPSFEERNSQGEVVFDNHITRLCRRQDQGIDTDEIILEMKDQIGYYSYKIIDIYPPNH